MKNALRDFFLSFNCRNCLHCEDCLTVYRSLLCFNLSVLATIPSMGISDLIHSQIQPVAPVFLSFDKVRHWFSRCKARFSAVNYRYWRFSSLILNFIAMFAKINFSSSKHVANPRKAFFCVLICREFACRFFRSRMSFAS